MKPIKCDTCIYLGGRHEQGIIPIQSGALPITEPYATCLKRQYFVLEREVEKCKDFKQESDKNSPKKGAIPYSFTTADIAAVFTPDTWLSFDEICTLLNLAEKDQTRYLPLLLKSMMQKDQVKMKLGDKKLLYSLF